MIEHADERAEFHDIEKIVRRARELAGHQAVHEQDLLAAFGDYKVNHDITEYALQSLIALQSANFYSMIPHVDEPAEAGTRRRLLLPSNLEQVTVPDEGGSRTICIYADDTRERLDPVRLQEAITALKARRGFSRAMG